MTNRGPIWSRVRFAFAALLTACDETGTDDDDPYAVEEIVASESSEFFDGESDVVVADANDTDADDLGADDLGADDLDADDLGADDLDADDLLDDAELELHLRAQDPVGCEALDDLDSCAAAGCHWLDTFGVVVDIDAGTCERGESIGLCYPHALAQPCMDSDTHCGNADAVWALAGPDGGLLMARSPNSCGVADGFLPCGSELLGEAATLACDCACA